ncbi:MAG: ABC transporter permease [Lachnospiraceae bacterium]|nr:ABC transporter permease [Lachnospiraceae bacterium]
MSYLYLAFRYLINGKKRTILTILGVTLVASLLYTGTWAVYSAADFTWVYSVAIRSADPELAADLIRDKRVECVKVGIYDNVLVDSNLARTEEEHSRWETEPILSVQLYRPITMKEFAEEITETYQVETIWNKDLFTVLDEEKAYLHALSLTICYILAVVGVILVRNSIQLSTMEQIRDYGNLRCIGATRRQLRAIVAVQGYAEVTAGLILALILSLIFTDFLNFLLQRAFILSTLDSAEYIGYRIKVLPLPILFVSSAFYFDLFFILQENLKRVSGMSAVEAISGHYRFINKKIKPRKARLIRRFFGIDGEYAYKNLMRNPGRVWKNVGILSVAIAFITSALLLSSAHLNTLLVYQEEYPHYQIQIDPTNKTSIWKYVEFRRLQNSITHISDPPLFETEAIQDLIDHGYITESRAMYQTLLLTSESLPEHLDPDVVDEVALGRFIKEDPEDPCFPRTNSWTFRGFTEEEKEIYRSALVEGTMDVSDHGIILTKGFIYTIIPDENDPDDYEMKFYENTCNMNLGDQITLPDPIRIEELKNEWIDQVYSNDETMIAMFREAYPDNAESDKNLLDRKSADYVAFQRKLCTDQYRLWYEEAMAEGRSKTFTIEGILSEDLLYETQDDFSLLLLPIDRYLELTGKDENTGITVLNYHIANPLLFDLDTLVTEYRHRSDPSINTDYLMVSDYTSITSEWAHDFAENIKTYLIIMLVIGGFLIVAFFNIRNTTKNSIYLRRKELAQLYVIGCTRNGLLRMIRYEGYVSTALAAAIGALLSIPSIILLKFDLMTDPLLGEVRIIWWIYPVALGIGTLLILGFYALSIRSISKYLKINPAEDLTASGE